MEYWEESHSPGCEACCVTSGELHSVSDFYFLHLYKMAIPPSQVWCVGS